MENLEAADKLGNFYINNLDITSQKCSLPHFTS
jgi:hypothetical protein